MVVFLLMLDIFGKSHRGRPYSGEININLLDQRRVRLKSICNVCDTMVVEVPGERVQVFHALEDEPEQSKV